MESANQMLTVSEVADLLRLNPLTIYSYIRSGKLKAARFGRTYRIDNKDLNDFVDSQKNITLPSSL